MDFYSMLENEFVPAAKNRRHRNSQQAAFRQNEGMLPKRHRAEIDKVVDLATKESSCHRTNREIHHKPGDRDDGRLGLHLPFDRRRIECNNHQPYYKRESISRFPLQMEI
jgi:hypothetical protein